MPIIKYKGLEFLGPKSERIRLSLRGLFGTIGFVGLNCSLKVI
jgi:hypothetical protein